MIHRSSSESDLNANSQPNFPDPPYPWYEMEPEEPVKYEELELCSDSGDSDVEIEYTPRSPPPSYSSHSDTPYLRSGDKKNEEDDVQSRNSEPDGLKVSFEDNQDRKEANFDTTYDDEEESDFAAKSSETNEVENLIDINASLQDENEVQSTSKNIHVQPVEGTSTKDSNEALFGIELIPVQKEQFYEKDTTTVDAKHKTLFQNVLVQKMKKVKSRFIQESPTSVRIWGK
eukprot:TCONS_00012470-protein